MRMQRHRSLIALVSLAALTVGMAGHGWLYGQDKLAAFKPVTTKVLRGGGQPQKLTVNVSGLKEMWLLATVGRDDYHHDRAAWGDPVLIDKAGKRTDLTTLKPRCPWRATRFFHRLSKFENLPRKHSHLARYTNFFPCSWAS